MKTKDVIYELRTKKGLSQEELAEKVYVTRQAVSRWETGKTIPDTETLKSLSEFFDVSINTLVGSPGKLICQCCGMPVVCLLMIQLSVKNWTVHLMRNIVSGAIQRENLPILILKS